MPSTEEIARRARVFPDRAALRAWFEANHATAAEIWIAYPKRHVERPGVKYPDVVEEALCFGWIDGQVRSLGPELYANRYSRRKAGSPWSQINLAKAKELRKAGRMHAAGIAAFEAWDPARRAGYTFEEPDRPLDPGLEGRFRRNAVAWTAFLGMPPGYQRVVRFWVMRAVRPETRLRRLDRVIAASSQGRRLDLLDPNRYIVGGRRPAPKRVTRRGRRR